MKWISRHRPSPGTTFGAVALMIALGGAAFAAIPDSNGTIHACYSKSNGNLRVAESADGCRTNERAISWNQEGPPGTPGGSSGRLFHQAEVAEVSTSGDTEADGGPSITVDVPSNALVAVYGAADINPCVSHLVGSADAVVWSGAQRVGYLRSYRLNRTGGYETLYSSVERDYTTGRQHATFWNTYPEAAGERTYTMRYEALMPMEPGASSESRGCGCRPDSYGWLSRSSAPSRIRTCGLLLRRESLCPAELSGPVLDG